MSQQISTIANAVLPSATGDEWRSENFTVLFPNVKWLTPCPDTPDGLWKGFAQLQGQALVRIHTDELSPIDITQLMIALRYNPIFIDPDPSVDENEFGIKLYFYPCESRDLMYESGIIPVMQGEIENCFILQRTGFRPENFQPSVSIAESSRFLK